MSRANRTPPTRTARTHAIAEWKHPNGSAKTFCGLTGWRSPNTDIEFDTATGTRFEIAAKPSCASCRRSSEKNRSGDRTPREPN